MLSPVSRFHLLALVAATGLFMPGIGCKSARPTSTTACPPLANSCCSPAATPCNPNPGCQGGHLLDKATVGNCDCAPHNPLDPYNRCGVTTTPPPAIRVVNPALPTALPQGIPSGHLPTVTPGVPLGPVGPPVTGNPLPPEVKPEPFKPMGLPLPEILKDSPMEKKNR